MEQCRQLRRRRINPLHRAERRNPHRVVVAKPSVIQFQHSCQRHCNNHARQPLCQAARPAGPDWRSLGRRPRRHRHRCDLLVTVATQRLTPSAHAAEIRRSYLSHRCCCCAQGSGPRWPSPPAMTATRSQTASTCALPHARPAPSEEASIHPRCHTRHDRRQIACTLLHHRTLP